MGNFVEPLQDEEKPNADNIKDDAQEIGLEEETKAVEAKEETGETTPDIPEKYKGKNLEEIVRMHQEAEKAIGRQGAEVGELRRVVDEFILSKKEKEPEPEVDFFENPTEAVKRIVKSDPDLQGIKQSLQEQEKKSAIKQLKELHPDMESIVLDENFRSWVGSNKVRQEMLRKADVEFDFETAADLFTLWKEKQGVVQQTQKAEQQSRKDTIRKASTGTAAASGEKSPKKVYRRADIIELMRTNPTRYEAMADEITQAYAEGRVR